MIAAVAALGLAWLALGLPLAVPLARRGWWLTAGGASPLAGTLALALSLELLVVLGLPVWLWPGAAALAALGLGLVTRWLLPAPSAAPAPGEQAGAGPAALLGLLPVLLAAAWLVSTGARFALTTPGFNWDGFFIWLVRTKTLADSDVVPRSLFAEELLVRGHWDYPLGLPAYLAWFRRYGGLELQQLALPMAVLAGSLLLATYALLLRRLGPALAAVAALCPLAVSGVEVSLHAGNVDGFVALTATTCAGCWLAGLRGDRRELLLVGGVGGAVLVSLKNEGALWLVSLLAAAALHESRAGQRREQLGVRAASLVGLPLLAFAGWRLGSRLLGARSDVLSGLQPGRIPARLVEFLGALGERLSEPGTFLLLAAGVGWIGLSHYWFPAGDRWWRPALRDLTLAATPPVVYLLGLTVVFTGTHHEDMSWLIETALTRVSYGVGPVFLVAALALTAEVENLAAAEEGGAVAENCS